MFSGSNVRESTHFFTVQCPCLQVRNKLDKCVYAIKKIRLSLSRKGKEVLDKILSEVTLLSRLNHENIVRYHVSLHGFGNAYLSHLLRYFNSWIEEDDTRKQDVSETDIGSTLEETESRAGMQKPKHDVRQQATGHGEVDSETADRSLSSGNIIAFQTGIPPESGGFDVSAGASMSPNVQFSTEDDIFLPHFRHYSIFSPQLVVTHGSHPVALRMMTAKAQYLMMTLCLLAAVVVSHPQNQ